jgi:hypothetical protein
MRKLIIVCALAAGLTLGVGGTAFAGEVNGKGESFPGAHKARSECAFSGQDLPDDIENNPPGFDDDAIMIHGVQSYGQFVSQGLKAVVPSPGDACRGNLGG